MWPGPRERGGGGERWIEKEARAKRERERGEGVREEGEKSCEWRRKSSADDETGTCGSACALRVFITDPV